MNSKETSKYLETCLICRISEKVNPGDSFDGCIVSSEDSALPQKDEKIICCGKISDDEMMFRTEDGRLFFSLQGNWGCRDGILYGTYFSVMHDFKRPTKPENIVDECIADRDAYDHVDDDPLICALVLMSHRNKLFDIITVMRNES